MRIIDEMEKMNRMTEIIERQMRAIETISTQINVQILHSCKLTKSVEKMSNDILELKGIKPKIVESKYRIVMISKETTIDDHFKNQLIDKTHMMDKFKKQILSEMPYKNKLSTDIYKNYNCTDWGKYEDLTETELFEIINFLIKHEHKLRFTIQRSID